MKKYYLILLCLSFVLCTGTASALVEIHTREDLEAIAQNPAGDYVLCEDIDLGDAPWSPVPQFSGSLDGADHTISHLTVQGTYTDEDVGLFGRISGTVSRLHLADIQFQVHGAGNYVYVSPFGARDYPNDVGLDLSMPKIDSCSVSGEISVSADEECMLFAFGLCEAVHSNQNIDFTVVANNKTRLYLAAYSADCTVNGNVHGSSADPAGIYSSSRFCALYECDGCTADADIRFDCGVSRYASVCGIEASSDCTLSGSLTSDSPVTVIDGRWDPDKTNNTSYALIDADSVTGLKGCHGCTLLGRLQVPGINPNASVCFIDDASNGSLNGSGNRCDCSFGVSGSGGALGNLSLTANVGEGSALNTPLILEDMGAINIYVYMFSSAADSVPYRNGEIRISTGSGNIDMGSYLATFADTTAVSETGSVKISPAASSNAGRVYAESGGSVFVVGGTVYNTGSVTAVCGGEADCSVYGARCLNVTWDTEIYNAGSISAVHNGSGKLEVCGAGSSVGNSGGRYYNQGNIDAAHNGRGGISAYGSYDQLDEAYICSNTGEITVRHNGPGDLEHDAGYSKVTGAKGGKNENNYNAGNIHLEAAGSVYTDANCVNGGVNTGDIYVKGPYHVWAYARTDNNTGNATAISTGFVDRSGSLRGFADASAAGGTAYANGPMASARGAHPTAVSILIDQTVTDGHFAHKLVSHILHSAENCHSPDVVITETEDFKNHSDFDVYQCYAKAYLASAAGQEPSSSDEPETGMPVDETPDPDGTARIEVFADQDCTNRISGFEYSYGSLWFSGGDQNDCTECYVRVTAENHSDETKYWRTRLTLPEGFSRRPWSVSRTDDISFVVPAYGSAHEIIRVYPIFFETQPDHVEFRLKGPVKAEQSVEVQRNGAEGVVACRATEGFSSQTVFNVRVDLDPVKDLYNTSANQYSPGLSLMHCALSQAVYEKDYIEMSFRNLGYTQYRFYNPSSMTSGSAVAIAQKKLLVDGEVKNSLAVVIRGTYEHEWIGNFLVNEANGQSSQYHDNFYNAAQGVMSNIAAYCEEYAVPYDRTKMQIDGHSRGGAVADLVGGMINGSSGFIRDFTVYTYAAPNSIRSPIPYGNIFNIVYYNDIVPFVPQEYGKHGITMVIGCKEGSDVPESVSSLFRQYAGYGVEYEHQPMWSRCLTGLIIYLGDDPYDEISREDIAGTVGYTIAKHPGDSPIARAHCGENYLAWLQKGRLTGETLVSVGQSHLKEFKSVLRIINKFRSRPLDSVGKLLLRALIAGCTINYNLNVAVYVDCPVNVELLDAGGNAVARFDSHSVVLDTDMNCVAMSGDETDVAVFPKQGDYSLRITATDDGTMNVGASEQEQFTACRFSGIPITRGEVLTLEKNDSENCMDWTLVSSSGNVYASEMTLSFDNAPARHKTLASRFENTENVQLDGWVDEFCLSHFDLLRDQLEGDPVWTVEMTEGSFEEGVDWSWSADESLGRIDLRFDRPPAGAADAVFRVACAWDGLAAEDEYTVHFVPVDTLPAGSTVPETVLMRINQETAIDLDFVPSGYRLDGNLRTVLIPDGNMPCQLWSEGGTQYILPAQAGVFSGFMAVATGNILSGHRVTFLVEDEQGVIPGEHAIFEDEACYDYSIDFALFEDRENVFHDSWVLDYAIADYDTLAALYGEPEWSAEVTEGDRDVVAWLIRRDEANGGRVFLWIEQTPSQPGSSVLRITASFENGPEVSGCVRMGWVQVDTPPEGTTVPQVIEMSAGTDWTQTFGFASEGAFSGRDRVNWGMADEESQESGVWAESDGFTVTLHADQTGEYPMWLDLIRGNIAVRTYFTLRVTSGTGLPHEYMENEYDVDLILPVNNPDPYGFWEGEGEVLYIWYDRIGTLTDQYGSSMEWVFETLDGPSPMLYGFYENDYFQIRIRDLYMMPAGETSTVRAALRCGSYTASTELRLHYVQLAMPQVVHWETEIFMTVGETYDSTVSVEPSDWYANYYLYYDHDEALIGGWNEPGMDSHFFLRAKVPGTFDLYPHLHIAANAFIFGPKITVHVSDGNGHTYAELRIPPDALDIEEEAFCGSAAEMVVITSGARIGSRAFADMPNLRIVQITSDTLEIADDAFEGNAGLIFYCPVNGSAAQFAQEHGFEVRCFE